MAGTIQVRYPTRCSIKSPSCQCITAWYSGGAGSENIGCLYSHPAACMAMFCCKGHTCQTQAAPYGPQYRSTLQLQIQQRQWHHCICSCRVHQNFISILLNLPTPFTELQYSCLMKYVLFYLTLPVITGLLVFMKPFHVTAGTWHTQVTGISVGKIGVLEGDYIVIGLEKKKKEKIYIKMNAYWEMKMLPNDIIITECWYEYNTNGMKRLFSVQLW